MSLQNQVALVTGGGRSIGKCIALRLARDGADVALLGPEQAELDETAAEVRQLGRRALAVLADVSREDQVEAAASTARIELGRIDILVNNFDVEAQ